MQQIVMVNNRIFHIRVAFVADLRDSDNSRYASRSRREANHTKNSTKCELVHTWSLQKDSFFGSTLRRETKMRNSKPDASRVRWLFLSCATACLASGSALAASTLVVNKYVTVQP